MCHVDLRTSRAFVRCSQAFEVSRLKSCFDPTGGVVTPQGPAHEPRMKGKM